MSNLKIKFKLDNLELEFDGEQDIVLKEYNQLKDVIINRLNNKHSDVSLINSKKRINSSKANNNQNTSLKKKVGTINSKSPKLNTDLNLVPKNALSLKDFYNKYDTKTNMERNLLFIYYLKQQLKRENVTIDDIFTCYKEVKARVPKQLYQSLIDTKNNKGWIDTKNTGDISITITGENYIEHDLIEKGE